MNANELKLKVDKVKEKVGNKLFGREECAGITTIATLKKYGYIEKVHEEITEELDLDEIVRLLTIALYNTEFEDIFEYKVIDNKVYEIEHREGYRFVK